MADWYNHVGTRLSRTGGFHPEVAARKKAAQAQSPLSLKPKKNDPRFQKRWTAEDPLKGLDEEELANIHLQPRTLVDPLPTRHSPLYSPRG